MRSTKLFIGPKIRNIRLESAQTQAKFAENLGISTSYLNQLENNQRHATATVLMALAQTYAVDIRSLSDNESERMLADLMEATNDKFFEGFALSNRDLKQVISNTPNFAKAFLTLHKSTQNLRDYLAETDQQNKAPGGQMTAYDEVRDYYHYNNNYFDTLDRAGEAVANTLESDKAPLSEKLTSYLTKHHNIKTIIGGPADYPMAIRHYDARAKTLYLNPNNRSSTNAFNLAHQIALLEQEDEIKHLAKNANFRSAGAVEICKIGLANYFAGSVLLPYQAFFEQADLLRHDLELMGGHFQASIEQIAHRLSTLQRPELKGIPFFFARVDQAGNITKRHSATKLQFARYGSACPLWNVHRAFEVPGRIIRQLAETPDGERYLCVATAINIRSGGFRDPVRRYALALGCETKFIDNIVYGDDLSSEKEEAYEPIGISCRTCERKQCHQRSVPPLRQPLKIDPRRRNILPYEL